MAAHHEHVLKIICFLYQTMVFIGSPRFSNKHLCFCFSVFPAGSKILSTFCLESFTIIALTNCTLKGISTKTALHTINSCSFFGKPLEKEQKKQTCLIFLVVVLCILLSFGLQKLIKSCSCLVEYKRRSEVALKQFTSLCGSKPVLQTGSKSLKAMSVYPAEAIRENMLLNFGKCRLSSLVITQTYFTQEERSNICLSGLPLCPYMFFSISWSL